METAAWVQAIGSLVAIGIAIWAPVWHERQRTRAARKRLTGAALALFEEANRLMGRLEHAERTDGWTAYMLEEIDIELWTGLEEALAAVPVHELAGRAEVWNVIVVRRVVRGVIAFFERDPIGMDPEHRNAVISEWAHLVGKALYGMRSSFED